MAFLFKRKHDPFIPDDIENKIIEMDELEQSEINEYNEHAIEPLNEQSFKHLNDVVVQGIFIMTIGGLCICFAFLSILYPLI
jgi:hypothetical protein